MEYFDSPGARDDRTTSSTPSLPATGSRAPSGDQFPVDRRTPRAAGTVIGQHGLAVDPRHAGTFFDQLRLLSGRLAFKLGVYDSVERTEVLGLALARLYLDYQGVLTDQVLVPLDDHLELYRDARPFDIGRQ